MRASGISDSLWARPHRGFTLIEVMIAVFILGILLVTVYGTISRVIAGKQHAEERAQLSSVGREAVLRIADEIEGSQQPTATNQVEFRGVSSGSSQFADQVQFTIVTRPPFGPLGGSGGRVVVTYSLDAVEGSDKVFALRRDEASLAYYTDDPQDAAADLPPPMAMQVIDQVAGLRFQYLDGQSGQSTRDWDTTAQETLDRLPLAVEVALFLYDSNGQILEFTTLVDLPLANYGRPTPTVGPQGQ